MHCYDTDFGTTHDTTAIFLTPKMMRLSYRSCWGFPLLVTFVIFVSVVSAAVDVKHNHRLSAAPIHFRGGNFDDDGGDDDIGEHQQGQSSSESDIDPPVDNIKSKKKKKTEKKKRRRSALSAAFQMNELAKEEASSVDEEILQLDTKYIEDDDDHETTTNQTNEREKLIGGAMVKSEPKKTNVDTDSLYKDTVSPMAARLISEPSSSAETESSSLSTTNSTIDEKTI